MCDNVSHQGAPSLQGGLQAISDDVVYKSCVAPRVLGQYKTFTGNESVNI